MIMDCLFCKIIKGEIPSYTIYEDELVKVFLDINPTNNGHMLIVPKNHILDIDSIDHKTLLHVIKIARKMKKLLEEKMGALGVSFIQNNGIAQEIKHVHLHLKPFYKKKLELWPVVLVYSILKESLS